jgi:hypothetical protein
MDPGPHVGRDIAFRLLNRLGHGSGLFLGNLSGFEDLEDLK